MVLIDIFSVTPVHDLGWRHRVVMRAGECSPLLDRQSLLHTIGVLGDLQKVGTELFAGLSLITSSASPGSPAFVTNICLVDQRWSVPVFNPIRDDLVDQPPPPYQPSLPGVLLSFQSSL